MMLALASVDLSVHAVPGFVHPGGSCALAFQPGLPNISPSLPLPLAHYDRENLFNQSIGTKGVPGGITTG